MNRFRALALGFLGVAHALAAPAPASAPQLPAHPRLLFTAAAVREARAGAETDPLRRTLHERIIALAREEMAAPPVRHVLIGPRLLEQSRLCLRRVLAGTTAYHLTGDSRFVAAATREMLAAADFPDWNPDHFLDTAELGLALAIGYDGLHAVLAPDVRARIEQALQTHLLRFAADAYAPGGPRDPRLRFVTQPHNWNQVCNTGMLAAALALADRDPAHLTRVLDGVRRSLPLAMAAYAPDGGYPEGPMYWGYGTSFNVLALAMLQNVFGTDFGLGATPGFDRTARFRLHVHGPTGQSFNYGDGDAIGRDGAEYTWLARRFGPAAALAHSRAQLEATILRAPAADETERLFPLHALWFPSRGEETGARLPPDARFRGPTELAFLRSGWDDPRALYVALKAGRNDVNHSHLDLGSFVLEADGVRWLVDLGRDHYDLPGYMREQRWSYYRLTNRSHNTLTFDDALQALDGVAPLTSFSSAPGHAFAVADLTAAYPAAAASVRRGVARFGDAQALVQDEIVAVRQPGRLVWRVLTEAAVHPVDARRVELRRDGRTLTVELLEPADASFVTAPAQPPTRAEDPNAGVTQLMAAIPTRPERDLRVAVRFVRGGAATAVPAPALRPLRDWR